MNTRTAASNATSRRDFLGASLRVGGIAALGAAVAQTSQAALADRLAGFSGPPESLATNEDFWLPIQQAFSVDRSVVNLNNGYLPISD